MDPPTASKGNKSKNPTDDCGDDLNPSHTTTTTMEPNRYSDRTRSPSPPGRTDPSDRINLEANERPSSVEPSTSCDPPEEIFDSPFRSSQYRGKKFFSSNSNNNFTDDDDQLDEYELEGLMMSPLSKNVPPTQSNNSKKPASLFDEVTFSSPLSYISRVGAGKLPSSRDDITLILAPVISTCHIMWDTKNRTKSVIALLFILLLCVIFMTVDDSKVKLAQDEVDPKDHYFSALNSKHDPMGKLTPEQRHSLLVDKFGFWGFYDGSAEDRPTEPYLTVEEAGPFLDLTEEKFPEESWQADAVYVNHFLDAAIKLVRRGQEALFAAYHGYGIEGDITVDEESGEVVVKGEEDGTHKDERLKDRLEMFHLEEIDLKTVTTAEYLALKSPDWNRKAGWTTERSFDGLERRLLHAMMTNSNFTIVVTGNWQSMGYGGNHGWQSMAGVIETFLGELFDRLGMKLVVRAIGLPPLESDGLSASSMEAADLEFGGRSTLIHTLGWSSIYGSDVDMVIWDDYGMNGKEGDDISAQLFDLFARQALLSGSNTLPFLWGGNFEVLRNLHEFADADVGQLGNGLFGVQETSNEKLAYELPWAAQFLNCKKDKLLKACLKEEYQFDSQCMIDELDVTASTPQSDHIPVLPGAIGWRMHQAKGYTVSYNILAALIDSMNTWSEKTIYEGHPLADEHWHVGKYITNVRDKVKTLDEANAPHCFKLEESLNLPKRLCLNPLKGRTEYTPRANPAETSIQSIVVPSDSGASVMKNDEKNPIDGASFENVIGKVPAGEVDAVELFNLLKKMRLRKRYLIRRSLRKRNGGKERSFSSRERNANHHQRRLDGISTGEGWQLRHAPPGDISCDGTLSSISSCGVSPSSSCYMEGHQGARGGVWGSESTEWLVMKITEMSCGYVSLNLEVGRRKGLDRIRKLGFDAPEILGNDESLRKLQTSDQSMKTSRSLADQIPDDFALEYAIDNEAITLDKSQLLERLEHPVAGMTLLNLVDDAASTTPKDVSIAIRVQGCSGVECEVAVTHVYWC